MKTNLLILTIILLFSTPLFAQKRVIDNSSYKNWEEIGNCGISNDGKFIWYEKRKNGIGLSEVSIISSDRKYQRNFSHATRATFTDDSQYSVLAYQNDDSLTLFNLVNKEVSFRHRAKSFRLMSFDHKQMLVYQNNDTVAVRSIKSDYDFRISGVKEYTTIDSIPAIILTTKTGLSWLNAKTFEVRVIHRRPIENCQFSVRANLIGFLSKNEDANLGLYICKPGSQAKLMVNGFSAGIEDGFTLSEEPLRFSPDGNLIYFKVRRTKMNFKKDLNLTGASVDVWHWEDKFLMSRQLETIKESLDKTFIAVLNIRTGKIIQLENDEIELVLEGERVRNKYVIVRDITYDQESYFNAKQIPKYYVVSLSNGGTLPFPFPVKESALPSLSPSEKFILWTNDDNKFSYEIATHNSRNLTEKIDLPKDVFLMSNAGRDSLRLGRSHWLADDHILVKDKYDYWLLDPMAGKAPTCITDGYGRKNNIQFELAVTALDLSLLRVGDKLLLKGQDQFSQESGFAITQIAWITKFAKKPFADCRYSRLPMRSQDAEIRFGTFNYLLMRESVERSPNLVITKDFKSFVQISDVSPEIGFNWLTSEIMHWNMLDGKPGLGMLYKPEDFSPTKKYPIIFYYYQTETIFESNRYLHPMLCSGRLNIPWYVSNGYLVFLVDIPNYLPGLIANSTINSVVSAAKYLSKFPWADSAKMGLQGHSFGGYETNILVANTNIFAAASSAAGLSDAISFSGDLAFRGMSLINSAEVGQLNLGTNPWTRPDIFIQNSPVFKVDKISTPLLLQSNKDDGALFKQGVEMFTAMRRAGKRVWLLQYDDQGHGLFGDAALDFTLRQQQFFDHYLKGKPMPAWMSRGISAKDKGIRSGLEYDPASHSNN